MCSPGPPAPLEQGWPEYRSKCAQAHLACVPLLSGRGREPGAAATIYSVKILIPDRQKHLVRSLPTKGSIAVGRTSSHSIGHFAPKAPSTSYVGDPALNSKPGKKAVLSHTRAAAIPESFGGTVHPTIQEFAVQQSWSNERRRRPGSECVPIVEDNEALNSPWRFFTHLQTICQQQMCQGGCVS